MARRVYGAAPSQKPVHTEPVVNSSEEEMNATAPAVKRAGKKVYGSTPASTSDESEDYVEIPTKKKKEKKPVNKKRRVAQILVSLFFFALFVAGALMTFKYKHDEAKVQALWDGVKAVAYKDTGTSNVDGEDAYSLDPLDREIDWDELLAINSDIKCWLYIPDTNIDYPVMQEQTLNEYFYLYHDIYKNYQIMGSILIPKEPDGFEDKDAKLMLFGHHMIGKQMFGNLTLYKSEDFYKEHPYIYLYYPDRTERWIVWSVFHTDATDAIYDLPYELGADDYAELIDHIETSKRYTTSAGSVDKNTNIMTLTTCDNAEGGHDGRFVVNSIVHKIKWLDKNAEQTYIKKQQEQTKKLREQERIRNTSTEDSYYDQYEIEYQGE